MGEKECKNATLASIALNCVLCSFLTFYDKMHYLYFISNCESVLTYKMKLHGFPPVFTDVLLESMAQT